MKPLTTSVVGGGAGGLLSLTALAQSPGYALAAAADLNPDVCRRLESRFPGLRAFTSHQEMFAQCPTDLVCVSTYPPTHEAVTWDALRLPLRAILVEKPLGHTVASGRRILEAVKARRLPMAVPHGLLVQQSAQEAAAHVRRGDIGALVLVEIQSPDWDILNAGIHWLNYFVALTGNEPMQSVLAQCDTSTRAARDGMQVETVAVTSAQTQSGVRVVMHTGDIRTVSSGKPDACTFRLWGTEGQIEFWAWQPDYRIQNHQHPQGTLISAANDASVPPHQRHLEALLPMVESGQPDYAIPDGSLLALEICEGAYLSHRHRCRVEFPVDTFVPPPLSDWNPGQPDPAPTAAGAVTLAD